MGEGVVYQAGATRHGIFYPGPHIRLTGLHPTARTALSVCDASASPNPLVLKKMDVAIRPESGMLKVTESLLVENPSHTCYVGLAAHDEAPVTLELSIPPDFERTTFDLEFFGRRFAVVNHKLVTSVPWPPGRRELRYTYVLRNTQEVTLWQRPLDLPCSHLTVRVEGKSSQRGPLPDAPPDHRGRKRCRLRIGRASARRAGPASAAGPAPTAVDDLWQMGRGGSHARLDRRGQLAPFPSRPAAVAGIGIAEKARCATQEETGGLKRRVATTPVGLDFLTLEPKEGL